MTASTSLTSASPSSPASPSKPASPSSPASPTSRPSSDLRPRPPRRRSAGGPLALWRRASLSVKILAPIAVFLVLSAVTAALWLGAKARRVVVTDLRASTGQLTSMLDTVLRTAMRRNARKDLEETVGHAGSLSSVRRAYLLNPEGQVRVTSDPSLAQTAGARELIARLRREGPAYAALRRTRDDRPFVMALAPVRAAPACLRCHHKHNKAGDHLGYLGVDVWAETGMRRARTQSRDIALATVGLGLLLLLGIGLLVRRRLGPLHQMATTARLISRGELGKVETLEVDGEDEIGVLADAFIDVVAGQRELAQAVRGVAAGQLDVSIVPRSPGDELSHDLLTMVDVNRRLMETSRSLAEAIRRGELAARGRPEAFEGAYRDLVAGINGVVEAFLVPISVTSERLQSIAAGVIPEPITEHFGGDFDAIRDAINRCIETVRALVTTANDLVGAAVRGDLRQRADARRLQGDFARIIVGFNQTLDAVVEPVQEAAGVLAELAQGELRVRMRGDYHGDHARIKDALNGTAEALHGAISAVAGAAEEIGAASGQIADASQSVAEGASQQASSLQEMAAALEQVAAMTQQNAQSTGQAQGLASEATSSAQRGQQAMQEMMGAMGQIRRAAEATAQIIQDINDVAFQTNLLALNAAVEAARAGDAGRGFAVVAEEVRSLAARAKEAARKTEALIRESVSLSHRGETISNSANANLLEIVTAVGKAATLIGEIAVASDEQTKGIDQVTRSVAALDQVTQAAAANTEQTSSAAEQLAAQAEELTTLVRRFQLDQGQVSAQPQGRRWRSAASYQLPVGS